MILLVCKYVQMHQNIFFTTSDIKKSWPEKKYFLNVWSG